MDTFSSLPILPKIKESLARLGITKPTDIQAKVVPFLLENPKRDVQAQAQTGTGKTLAFGIPLLHTIDTSLSRVQALVIAPTRELVMQIYENLKDISHGTGIVLEPIYGGMPIERQIANLKRGPHIIIGTPGRVNDHLRRKTLTLNNLKVFVLDEADIMLDMGFKEEIDDIFHYTPTSRQIWLFSATVMPGIKQLIKSHMKDVFFAQVTDTGVAHEQIKQYFCVVPHRKRVEAAARFIESAPDFYGILFCQTKTLTSEVTEQLASRGYKVDCLHGDMKQTVRNRVIKGFKSKNFNILVATNVAARGLDVSDLTHVISFSIPEEHESYVHRIGRTGRAGKEGVAIVFVSPQEMYRIGRLESATHTLLQEITVPPLNNIISSKMSAVSDFIEQSKKQDPALTPVHAAITELVQSFSEQEIRGALAKALEERFFKDIVRDLKSAHIGDSLDSTRSSSAQEICIEIGMDDGFGRDDVRRYVCDVCGLRPDQLAKIRVLNKRTFVCVPPDRTRECVNAMLQKPITPTHIPRVYTVQDFPRERGGEGRRSEGRRDRRSGRRPGRRR